MPFLGVNIAIIFNGKILLTKREDFEVWCLPGGGVENGESVAQTAIREAREETGLIIELTHLIGVYSRPFSLNGGSHIVLLAAHPVGGSLQPDTNEVVELRYFDPDELPEVIFNLQRKQAMDALNRVGGSVVWTHNADWPFDEGLTRRGIYQLRDDSGLSRRDFYMQHFESRNSCEGVQEIVGSSLPDLKSAA
jgi:ADP-ribose pyrophosphatase YjhB (NUDIX family)